MVKTKSIFNIEHSYKNYNKKNWFLKRIDKSTEEEWARRKNIFLIVTMSSMLLFFVLVLTTPNEAIITSYKLIPCLILITIFFVSLITWGIFFLTEGDVGTFD